MVKVEKKRTAVMELRNYSRLSTLGATRSRRFFIKAIFMSQYTINERSDGLVCMVWTARSSGKPASRRLFNKGGSVLADGLLLSVDGNKMLYLIEPDPSGFKPLASVELLEPGENWAPIALADGKLLIRDQKLLKCLKVAQ